MDANHYSAAPFNAISDELFDSGYTTRQLARELFYSICGKPYGREEADAMWAEFEVGDCRWYRGNICCALADLGTTLRKIHFRHS